jgi:hypothetical protein
MPAADAAFGWEQALLAYGVLVVAAYLVTWVVTDRLNVPRGPYVAVLSVTVIALGAGYLMWSGTSLADLVSSELGWGIVAGLVVAGAVAPLVRRLPRHEAPTGFHRAGLMFWEDVVYGMAEGLLLATYPVLTVWHAVSAAGWTNDGWARVGAGSLSIVGALFVILVHHLGYRQFRQPAGRRMLAGVLVSCGLQAVAFLVTGNVLAPLIAHVVLHTQLTLRGDEMPPAARETVGLESDQRAA